MGRPWLTAVQASKTEYSLFGVAPVFKTRLSPQKPGSLFKVVSILCSPLSLNRDISVGCQNPDAVCLGGQCPYHVHPFPKTGTTLSPPKSGAPVLPQYGCLNSGAFCFAVWSVPGFGFWVGRSWLAAVRAEHPSTQAVACGRSRLGAWVDQVEPVSLSGGDFHTPPPDPV